MQRPSNKYHETYSLLFNISFVTPYYVVYDVIWRHWGSVKSRHRPFDDAKTIRADMSTFPVYFCKIISPMHYSYVIIRALASQITSRTIIYSTVYSSTDQIKHQSSASLSFVRGIHRWLVNSPHKGSVTRKMFPFDDVIMGFGWCGLKFLSHSQTAAVQPLTFGNRYIIPSHILLGMWLLIMLG